MVKLIEAKGETIDIAIENAATQLGCDRYDPRFEVDEVLQKDKPGFLGIGKLPAIVRVRYQASPSDAVKSFVDGLLFRFGTPANINATEDAETRTINLTLAGENMGTVIGRHGDTLDAIQYLAGIIANREESEHWRVVLDTEGYRAKREDALVALANKTAEKALKYKKPVALDPMSPHERRIIHMTLQENPALTTYSTGSEGNRKVVVAPAGMGNPPTDKRIPQGGSNPNYRRRRNNTNRSSTPAPKE